MDTCPSLRASKGRAIFLTNSLLPPSIPVLGKDIKTKWCWIDAREFGMFSGYPYPWPSLLKSLPSYRVSPGFENTLNTISNPGSAIYWLWEPEQVT